jgi:hypothetical protein
MLLSGESATVLQSSVGYGLLLAQVSNASPLFTPYAPWLGAVEFPLDELLRPTEGKRPSAALEIVAYQDHWKFFSGNDLGSIPMQSPEQTERLDFPPDPAIRSFDLEFETVRQFASRGRGEHIDLSTHPSMIKLTDSGSSRWTRKVRIGKLLSAENHTHREVRARYDRPLFAQLMGAVRTPRFVLLESGSLELATQLPGAWEGRYRLANLA